MIRIQQLKLPIEHEEQDIINKACKKLKIREEDIESLKIIRRSIDSRKKSELSYVYTVDVHCQHESRLKRVVNGRDISFVKKIKYQFPKPGETPLSKRPIIIGCGPAGLFCAYFLAKAGYAPIVLERGKCVEERIDDVEKFWQTGVLDTVSNVQFGEGGAGTFSDGKLNTMVKDPLGRGRKVLEIFVEMGAPQEILYDAKPHIGTDVLVQVVKNLRNQIIEFGGEIRFENCMTDIQIDAAAKKLNGITINHEQMLETEAVVLAPGHSARDTFEMLYEKGVAMQAKAFAVGLRVEHPQKMINDTQYHGHDMTYLPTAAYKVSTTLENKRGVYSFCMCPGGYVVNASSEEQAIAVNGMSYQNRDSANGNSAIVVSVTPEDFKDQSPLGGIAFQRQLEQKAYELGGGSIPQQLYGDFKTGNGKVSSGYGAFSSCTKGKTAFANLRELFSEEINQSFIAGMEQFGKYMDGFSREDAILSGVESRTSSPIRIQRNESLEADVCGLYPCGEGAGYAGGITSAAMDGIKTAEAIATKFTPCYTT